MKFLSLSINKTPVAVPSGVPSGELGTTGEKIISLALELLLLGGVLLALVFLIYAGVMWIMAGGDKQKMQSARTQIIYSIIGLVIIFLSFLLIQIIGNFFNISFIK